MTEPKFTKGPWFVCDDPPNDNWFRGYTIGSTPEGTRICDLTHLRGAAENNANARLIAAAPELYEAVRRARILLGFDLTAKIDRGCPDFNQACRDNFDRCSAALAKAVGPE